MSNTATADRPVETVSAASAGSPPDVARRPARDITLDPVAPARPGLIRRAGQALAKAGGGFNGYIASFFLLVVLPSIAAAIYFALIATDQYVVETRFAVRNQAGQITGQDNSSSPLSMLSGALGTSSPSQDARIVAQYLTSRAAIDDVSAHIDLRQIYARSGADFVMRLQADASPEDLEQYWKRMVLASVDGLSGIVTLQVHAFRPEDARVLSERLIRSAEALINRLSERARLDVLADAEAEVRRTEAGMRKALANLRTLRDREGILDPTIAANSTAELLLRALSERIRIQTDLSTASQVIGRDAPTLNTFRAQLESIDTQIAALREALTSNSGGSRTVSAFLVRYEELEIERIFAEKMYDLAQNALQRARLKAERQQIYLSVFVYPSTPQEARFPERLMNSLVLPFVFLVIWGIISLVYAAIDDHRY
jgi:capsular polysaccharide transport system permease protein